MAPKLKADKPVVAVARCPFRPLGNRVVVKIDNAEDVTKGGIILPDAAKKKPKKGTVVAVGPGTRNPDGSFTPPEVKIGDRVLHAPYAGNNAVNKGEEWMILDATGDIFAIIEDDDADQGG